MDSEKFEVHLVEAWGKATAAIAVNAAVVALLINKGLIAAEDAAQMTATANTIVDTLGRDWPDSLLVARAAIRGFSRSYASQIKRH